MPSKSRQSSLLKHLKSKLSFVYNAPQFVNHAKPLKLYAKLHLMCKILAFFFNWRLSQQLNLDKFCLIELCELFFL